MINRNDSLMVSISARDLSDLTALAGGYSMSHGRFIGKSIIILVDSMLYDAGFETYDEEPLPGASGWNVRLNP